MRGPGGFLGLALVNLDVKAQTVTFQVPQSARHLCSGPVKLRAVYSAGLSPDAVLSGSVPADTVTLPPHSAATLSLAGG